MKFNGKHIIGSVFLLINLVWFIGTVYDLSETSKQKHKWSDKDREGLIQGILENAPHTTEHYPEIARGYCECAADKIMRSMTRDRYMEISKKSEDEMAEIFTPLVQDCLAEIKRKKDSIDQGIQ